MEIQKNQSLVGRICKIHHKNVKNMLDSRSRLPAEEAKQIPISVKRPHKALYPLIKAEVLDFIKWLRSERFPVASYHVKSRAFRAASRQKYLVFLHRMDGFRILYTVQRFKLHSKSLEKQASTYPRMPLFECRKFEILVLITSWQISTIWTRAAYFTVLDCARLI